MYPQLSRKQMALQEFYTRFKWPKITGVPGLVPGYTLVKLMPSYSGPAGLGGNASGFLHIGTLDYTVAVPGIIPGTPEQVLHIHSDLVFNDGVSPLGGRVDSGFSHAQVGISTDIDVGFGIALTSSLYYQSTEESSVKADDGFWATFGTKYVF